MNKQEKAMSKALLTIVLILLVLLALALFYFVGNQILLKLFMGGV